MTEQSETAALRARIVELEREVAVDDAIIADYQRVVDLFECPPHGRCVPFAIEQIEWMRRRIAEMEPTPTHWVAL